MDTARSDHGRGPDLFPLAVWWVAALLAGGGSASALDEFRYDLRLAKQLNRVQMFDYAVRHINDMLTRYPKARELIMLEQSRTYYLMGKRKQADETLAEIKPASPHYGRARLVLGEMAFRRGDMGAASKAYAEYFAKNTSPPGDDREDVEEFRDAVQWYAAVLKKAGDGAGAAKVMGYLANIKGDQGATDRQLGFLKGQAMLTAADESVGAGKALDKAVVERALKALNRLQWQGVDAVTAAALVEVAHGNILLGDDRMASAVKAEKKGDKTKALSQAGSAYDKALTTLKGATEIMTQVENVLRKQGETDSSPVAGAFYYYGKAQKGQAFAAFQSGGKDDAKKLLVSALKRFYKVTKDYQGSPYALRAMAEFGKCKKLLEDQFGMNIKLSAGGAEAEVALKMRQADAFLRSSRFEDAAELYVGAVRRGRTSAKLPEVAVRLVLCYGKLGRYLEAEALTAHLAEAFPEDPDTSEALLKFGAVLYQAGKEGQDAVRGAALRAQAMDVWERFVDVAPSHPKAADVAFSIAESAYRRASEVAKATADMNEGAERESRKKSARELYRDAIPKYERLVKTFSNSPRGIRAFYKLGWIHYSLGERKQAADAFRRYADLEVNPELNDDRLEAKFRAAESLMFSDSPAESVTELTVLLGWLKPDNEMGIKPSTKRAKRIHEDATSYLAWACDLSGETYRPRLTDIREASQEARRAIKDSEGTVEQAKVQREQADKGIEEVTAAYAEREAQAKGTAPGAAELAEATSKARGEDLGDMSAEEQEVAKREAVELAKRLQAGMRDRERQRLTQERRDYETEREQVKARKAVAAERLERLGEVLKEARADLAKRTTVQTSSSAELEQLEETLQRLQTVVSQGRAEVERWDKDLESAKAAQKVGTAEERATAGRKRREAAIKKHAARAELRKAQAELDTLQTQEAVGERKALALSVRQQESGLKALREGIARDEKQEVLTTKRAAALQARLIALAKALDQNKLEQKLFDSPPEQRAAAEADVDAERVTVLGAFREAKDKRVEQLVLAKTMAEEEIAKANQRVRQAQERIAQLAKEEEPIKAAFEKEKRKAQQHFLAFMKAYPNSKHVPDNIARLGTIYIEFKEFTKAAEHLERLAAEHPKAEAGKRAFFNLGRAQFEIGKHEEAAAAFGKLLGDAEGQPVSNLTFISDKMLEARQPKLSLAASQELLRRAEKKGPDADEGLQPATRENALFRAGESAFLLKDFKRALAYYDELLAGKPNTAYFYDLKFHSGVSKRSMKPAEAEGAIRDFNEILQYADEQTISNRALCELGETYAQLSGKKNVQLALARFQQVVMLADPNLEGNRPWIEGAIYGAARCAARLGEGEQRGKLVERYRKEFPDGRFRREINSLPKAEF